MRVFLMSQPNGKCWDFQDSPYGCGKWLWKHEFKIYNFSTIENIRLQYELKDTKEGDKEIKGVVILDRDPTWLSLLFVLTEAGRFLSSRSPWARVRLGPPVSGNGNFRTVSHPAILLSVLTKAGKSLNSFAMLKVALAVFSKNQGAKVIRCWFMR